MVLIEYQYLKDNLKDFGEAKKWIYLGNDYKHEKFLLHNLSAESQVKLGQDFLTLQKKLKNKYIAFVDDLSRSFDSFKWWVSDVAEKNVFARDVLFTNICFIDYVLQYKEDEIMIIADDVKLLETIKENRLGAGLFKCRTGENIFSKLKSYYKTRRRFVVDKIKSRKDIAVKLRNRIVGLVTWIDKRNFSNGKFRENYFGRFFNKLKNNNDYILLPLFLYTFDKRTAKQKLQENNIKYIDLYSGYKIIDVLKAFFKSLFYIKPLLSEYIFDKRINLTLLLKNQFLNDIIENRYADYYLKYYAVKRLIKDNLKFRKIIYPFENQPWEKVLCLAFKKYLPETELVGYMHTMPLEFLLSIFPGEYEKENMPQPDKIFTTGSLTTDELKKYYQTDKVVKNSALRYEYLFNKDLKIERLKDSKIEVDKKGARKNILIVLSADYNKSLYIVQMVIASFKNKKDYKVIIKPHPTYILREEEIAVDLPDNFVIVEEPVSELLKKVDLVVNNMTMVGLEALKMRVPVIEIELPNFINLNRFDYWPELKISAVTDEDIFNKTVEILNWTEEKRCKYFEKAKKFLEYCFNKPNEEYIKKFLD